MDFISERSDIDRVSASRSCLYTCFQKRTLARHLVLVYTARMSGSQVFCM